MKKLEYKNPTNWLIAIALPIPLLIFIITTIILLFLVIFSNDILSKIDSATFLLPCLAFVLYFLWIWLWNTFGKTIIIFNNDEISVKKKFNIFYKKKNYLKNSISKVFIQDRSIEKNKQLYKN